MYAQSAFKPRELPTVKIKPHGNQYILNVELRNFNSNHPTVQKLMEIFQKKDSVFNGIDIGPNQFGNGVHLSFKRENYKEVKKIIESLANEFLNTASAKAAVKDLEKLGEAAEQKLELKRRR